MFGDTPNDATRAGDEIRRIIYRNAAVARFSTQQIRNLVTTFGRAAIAAALAPDGPALLSLYNDLEAFRAEYDGVAPAPLP